MNNDRLLNTLSSTHWSWAFYPGDSLPNSLITLLQEKLPHIDPSSWKDRLIFGGAFLNGKAITQDVALNTPCRIEYYETKYPIESAAAFFPQFDPTQIIYNDGDLAVVVKPYGLPCFEAREQRLHNLRTQIESHFGHAVHMPSRLDTSVTGLVLISLNQNAHDKLQKIFERREIEKTYVMQSATSVDWREKVVDAPIGRDERHTILRKVLAAGGKAALTKFEQCELKRNATDSKLLSTFRAFPLTGRTHQIRVHAAHLGIPIIGDNFYGGIEDPELRLASFAIRLKHPLSARELLLSLPQQFQPEWLKIVNAYSTY